MYSAISTVTKTLYTSCLKHCEHVFQSVDTFLNLETTMYSV